MCVKFAYELCVRVRTVTIQAQVSCDSQARTWLSPVAIATRDEGAEQRTEADRYYLRDCFDAGTFRQWGLEVPGMWVGVEVLRWIEQSTEGVGG